MLPSKLQKGLVSVQDPKLHMWPSFSAAGLFCKMMHGMQKDGMGDQSGDLVEMVGWKQCPKNLQTKYSGYKIHNKALAISTHTIIRTCKRQNLFSEVGIRVEMHLQYSMYLTVYETHTQYQKVWICWFGPCPQIFPGPSSPGTVPICIPLQLTPLLPLILGLHQYILVQLGGIVPAQVLVHGPPLQPAE